MLGLLSRCWHLLLFFAAWSTLITVLNEQEYNLSIQSTLLTVLGTVLGFVLSYRTTSAFERYNEGRRLWSQIVLASRTFARMAWFHVPDLSPEEEDSQATAEDLDNLRARALIEKKTVINLLEAFSVAVKHYLRGEEGIYYKDLYYLVKFLPPYALPTGIYSSNDTDDEATLHQRTPPTSTKHLPLPTTASRVKRQPTFTVLNEHESLSPAYMPGGYSLLDLFPFSVFQSKRDREFKVKKAARMRIPVSQNLPLEISLYLSSWVSALQVRKTIDTPTTNVLLFSLNQLVDSLTGLERILTTPIPFSYATHLWVVILLYCLFLPFQIFNALGWVTIPATVLVSFIFCGILVAGEEIENPFGYDKNDLNLDHFTHNIIRNELRAITSTPPPDPRQWVFVPENDLLFAVDVMHKPDQTRVSPEEWLRRGRHAMHAVLQ